MSLPPQGDQPTRHRPPAVVGTLAGSALVLGLLTLAVATGWAPLARVDRAVSLALYAGDDRPAALSVALEVATAPGLSAFRLVVLLPVVIWLLVTRRPRVAGWVTVAAVLVGVVTAVLKELLHRARPAFEDGGARYDSFAFPSGHSSGIACLVTIALVLCRPVLAPRAWAAWRAVGVAVVLLVGLTRLWLGVHHASDVLAGWALGVALTLLVALAFGALPDGPAALRGRAGEPAGTVRR